MKVYVLGVVALLSAGCAMQRAQTAQNAQVQMIGMSSEDVLACMGPPENRDNEGNTEVWSYSSDGRTVGSGTSFGFGTGGYSGHGVGVDVSNYSTTDLYCLVNVVMDGGRVRNIRYQGPTGGALALDEQCAYAVEQCVR